MTELVLSVESNEKDLALFTVVFRLCVDIATEVEKDIEGIVIDAVTNRYHIRAEEDEDNEGSGGDINRLPLPLTVFVAPLWKDLWRVVGAGGNSSQNMKLLVSI